MFHNYILNNYYCFDILIEYEKKFSLILKRDFIYITNTSVHTGRPQCDCSDRVNHLIACMEDSASSN